MYKKLLLLVVAAATMATQTAAIGLNDTVAVLAGFMSVVIQKDNLAEMRTCAQDTDKISGDVENLIADIESLSFTGFFKAIETFGKISGEAPYILRDCENLQDDINTLKEQTKIFTDLGELTQRITKNYIWHYTEIMTALNEANVDANSGNYYGFGENIADAVFIALQP